MESDRGQVFADTARWEVEPHVFRHLREELAQPVLCAELAVHLQAQDGGGGELLGDRSDVERRVRLDRRAGLAIGQPIPLPQQELAMPGHQDGAGEAVVGEA